MVAALKCSLVVARGEELLNKRNLPPALTLGRRQVSLYTQDMPSVIHIMVQLTQGEET